MYVNIRWNPNFINNGKTFKNKIQKKPNVQLTLSILAEHRIPSTLVEFGKKHITLTKFRSVRSNMESFGDPTWFLGPT